MNMPNQDWTQSTDTVRPLSDQLHELYPWALTVARLLSRDDQEASDLVQDALVRAVERAPPDQSIAQRRAWLRTTITRLNMNRLRRRRVEMRAFLRYRESERGSWLDESTANIALLKSLERLPPRQRACVVLRYLEDMAEAEIAETLRIREGTVKAHLAQARERLRTANHSSKQ